MGNSMRLKVEEYNDLFRDSNNQAILTTDTMSLKAYKNRKKQSQDINRLSDDINNIKNEMSELKSLCLAIMGKING